MEAIAMKPGPVTPRQRKRALVTGLALAAMVLAIYAFVLYRYVTH